MKKNIIALFLVLLTLGLCVCCNADVDKKLLGGSSSVGNTSVNSITFEREGFSITINRDGSGEYKVGDTAYPLKKEKTKFDTFYVYYDVSDSEFFTYFFKDASVSIPIISFDELIDLDFIYRFDFDKFTKKM